MSVTVSTPAGGVRMVCPACGSTAIVQDATARWNETSQSFEIDGLQRSWFCWNCHEDFNAAREIAVAGARAGGETGVAEAGAG